MFVAAFPAGPLQANCYVVAAERGGPCLIIDPGDDAVDLLDATLREHELDPTAILLTHGHLDHCGSAADVARARSLPVHLHAADEYMLDDPLASLPASFRPMLAGRDFSGLRPPEVELLHPESVLALAGLSVFVAHTPGHTGGSVTFRLPAAGETPELLFTGDTLFAGSIGRTDLPGGSTARIHASIAEKLLTRDDSALVLPGHGPASTIGTERSENPFLA